MNSRLYPIAATAAAGLLAAAVVFSSCQKNEPRQNEPRPDTDRQQALLSRGKAVYQSVCIACHNTDPKKPGSLGPEIWGASLELLRARVQLGSYPPGYKPKRPTHVMQPLPQVQGDLPAIQAYLNTPSD